MLSDRIAAILQTKGSMSVAEVFNELYGENSGDPELLEVIERTLFAGHYRFKRDQFDGRRWSLADNAGSMSCSDPPMSDTLARSLEKRRTDLVAAREMLPAPYRWQLEALDAWKRNGRRGIVEAVTGSGKTMVGMLAMLEALEDGTKVHIVVPTIELQTQWLARIRRFLPNQTRVGRRGGGYHSNLDSVDVLISVVNSVRGSGIDAMGSSDGLIVVDECHRFASSLNSHALASEFSGRLGLSATYRRDDNRHQKILLPYFDGVCYSLDYERARLDAVIADFGVVFVGVSLSGAELDEYRSRSDEIAVLFGSFRRLLRQDFADYQALIGTLLDAASGKYRHISARIEDIARLLLSAMRQRRRFLEFVSGKLDALVFLGPEICSSSGTVIFTQSIEVAQRATTVLKEMGINACAIHSGTDKEVRSFYLRKFASGEVQAIVAPRILDEGIDFPDADFAVVLAASNSKRQMIQRMGRVLRPKKGGHHARIAVIFAEDTVEDPRFGAHEMFRQDVYDSASALEIVSSNDWRHALEFLMTLRCQKSCVAY